MTTAPGPDSGRTPIHAHPVPLAASVIPRTISPFDAGPAWRFQTIKAKWPTVDLPQLGGGEAVISYPLSGHLGTDCRFVHAVGGPEAPQTDLDA